MNRFKLTTLLCSLILLVGCSDSTTEPNDDGDGGNDPTVSSYDMSDGKPGMNISSFFGYGAVDSLVVESEVTMKATSSFVARFFESQTGGEGRIHIEIDMRADIEVDSDPVSLFAAVTVYVPGQEPGTFDVADGEENAEVRVSFSYEDEDVLYKSTDGTVTLTSYEPGAGAHQGAHGSFDAILRSPEGKKIAVKGAF